MRLTKTNVKFHWVPDESRAFHQLKNRLCTKDIPVPYNRFAQPIIYRLQPCWNPSNCGARTYIYCRAAVAPG